MAGARSARELLEANNKERYQAFCGNEDIYLKLPRLSRLPWFSFSGGYDVYTKTKSHVSFDAGIPHIKFIKKNSEPHGFIWQTDPITLKHAVRWGIVRAESCTAKVIAALGKYRVIAHERVAKAMVSNTQATKLSILDLFQDRFERLQEIESLVNTDKSLAEHQQIFVDYIASLQELDTKLDGYFKNKSSGINAQSIVKMRADVQADILRAENFKNNLNAENLVLKNRARGHDSILEFVKQQMLHNLYEFQGINQDMTYSLERNFAATRGDLNDAIEDARKLLDEHQPDLVNAVRPCHHGAYGAGTKKILYHFEDLSPQAERDALLAISFLEKWDKVKNTNVHNMITMTSAGLDTIKATKWQTHRNLGTALKSYAYYLLNLIKSFVVATVPWEEEAWDDPSFHLHASWLRQHARKHEPLWYKPFNFFKQIYMALADMARGISNVWAELIVELPTVLKNDWSSSLALPTLDETLAEAEAEIARIKTQEEILLVDILQKCVVNRSPIVHPVVVFAQIDYTLVVAEENDLLTSVFRGVKGFGDIFSTMYAKNPFVGLAFTAAYAAGGLAIYAPTLAAQVFGTSSVTAFNSFAYAVGSSQFSAFIAGGSTLAQGVATGVDLITYGPSSLACDTLYKIGQDPLTIAAYFTSAHFIGYILANGVGGHPIPFLSEYLKSELGQVPEAGYALVGGKFAFLGYEALMDHGKHADNAKFAFKATLTAQDQQRIKLIQWLFLHQKSLKQLNSTQLYTISRHIDAFWTKAESSSLKKLIYPELERSIAYQAICVPLDYIPLLFRSISALVLSVAAAVAGNPNPAAPIKRVLTQLSDKIAKDLSRLLILASYIIYIPYMFIATMIKMLAYCAVIIIGRIASLGGYNIGHGTHQFFADIHGFFRKIGEFFFPVAIITSVSSADPVHAAQKIQSSYERVIRAASMTPVAETPVAETPVAETPVAETPVAETPVAEPYVADILQSKMSA